MSTRLVTCRARGRNKLKADLERTRHRSLGPGDKQPLQAWVGCSARLEWEAVESSREAHQEGSQAVKPGREWKEPGQAVPKAG